MTSSLEDWLKERRHSDELKQWAEGLLWELCLVDTSLGSDLDRLKAGERECYRIFEEAVRPYLPEEVLIRDLSVPASIADDDYYTIPYYAGELSGEPEKVYEGRANLLIDPCPGQEGANWLLNAHIDTVPPHIEPSRPEPGRISGRGSADNKNGVVAAGLVARMLHQWQRETGQEPQVPVRYMVSIDEEMGGNGTLGAVTHLNLEDSRVVVMEPSNQLPYPSNRGAVWFEVTLNANSSKARRQYYGLYADIARSLADAGRRLRSSSHHPLYHAQKDAQTCFGVLGEFGRHPSSACDLVSLSWPVSGADAQRWLKKAQETAQKRLDEAVAEGRLTHLAQDPEWSLESGTDPQTQTLVLTIHALGGHMGSHERDSDALAKAAEFIDALYDEGFGLPKWPESHSSISFEGGQGFLPDNRLDNVQELLRQAFSEGVSSALNKYDLSQDDIQGQITFDKLHNAAFCSADDAQGGIKLARAIGILNDSEPPELKGWKASCDARIFARQSRDVVTFGPGALEVAHSPRETMLVDEILEAAVIAVHAILSPDLPIMDSAGEGTSNSDGVTS
ncbi:M20/M25/M40 family metallo-hydrolase [Hahella ganghwensis]|uniref:M20/M25/M40 family metallo-hydrolase n=1 Tax=Hahella ganghwensis TaxID=286420 RepID=UPI0003614AEE|nr:M20/M25/M40 family metallo-hydrolase [Hahella ganghwensis]